MKMMKMTMVTVVTVVVVLLLNRPIRRQLLTQRRLILTFFSGPDRTGALWRLGCHGNVVVIRDVWFLSKRVDD